MNADELNKLISELTEIQKVRKSLKECFFFFFQIAFFDISSFFLNRRWLSCKHDDICERDFLVFFYSFLFLLDVYFLDLFGCLSS